MTHPEPNRSLIKFNINKHRYIFLLLSDEEGTPRMKYFLYARDRYMRGDFSLAGLFSLKKKKRRREKK